MKRVILAILMLTTPCFAQIRYENLKLIDAKDPARPALEAWKKKVLEGYEKSFVEASFNSFWYEMPFDSLKRLFPNYRFFAIEWKEHPVKGKEKEVIGLGGGEYTLVCSKDHKVAYEIYHYGNYEPYGKLLANRKAVIRSSADAQLVWAGFCDLHQKHWKDQKAIKVSETIWHLGDKTTDGVHYYYEVILNAQQRIQSATLHSNDPRRPKAE